MDGSIVQPRVQPPTIPSAPPEPSNSNGASRVKLYSECVRHFPSTSPEKKVNNDALLISQRKAKASNSETIPQEQTSVVSCFTTEKDFPHLFLQFEPELTPKPKEKKSHDSTGKILHAVVESGRKSGTKLVLRYVAVPTDQASCEEIWSADKKAFNRYIGGCTVQELAIFGTYSPNELKQAYSNKFTGQQEELAKLGAHAPDAVKQAYSEKLQAYYSIVLQKIKEDDKGITPEWLKSMLIPIKRSHYQSCELFSAVSNWINRNINNINKTTEICDLAKIMEILTYSNSFLKCLPGILKKYTDALTEFNKEHLTTFTNIIMSATILHANLEKVDDALEQVENDLRRLLQRLHSFCADEKPSLNNWEKHSLHHLFNYAHYVLDMKDQIPAPHWPEDHKEEIYSSQFQTDVQEKLDFALSPQLPLKAFSKAFLKAEYKLEKTEFTIDLFCEPDIVIEVDGSPHYSESLLLNEDESAIGKSKSLLKGKTIAKKHLLTCAGYKVINISDQKDDTIKEAASEIRKATFKHLKEKGKLKEYYRPTPAKRARKIMAVTLNPRQKSDVVAVSRTTEKDGKQYFYMTKQMQDLCPTLVTQNCIRPEKTDLKEFSVTRYEFGEGVEKLYLTDNFLLPTVEIIGKLFKARGRVSIDNPRSGQPIIIGPPRKIIGQAEHKPAEQ